jgi:SRSO17 transposase
VWRGGSDRCRGRCASIVRDERQPFVLAVPANEPLWRDGPVYLEAREIAADLPAAAWQRLSAGAGAKGPRWYDWAWQPLWCLQLTPEERAQGHWLLIRRSLDDPTEVAYYVVFAPRTTTTLEIVVRVAGMRWAIESGFEMAKSACGLDEYEVRKWAAWYRHITFALLAHAFLTVMRAQEREKGDLRTSCYP